MNRSNHRNHYDNYETAKTNLQRETAALLAERNQLESRFAVNQPPRSRNRETYAELTSLTPIAMQKKTDNNKTQEVINKLQQIIKLCKQQGSLSNQEMREVIRVQNQVLHFLHKTNTEPQPKLVNPHYEQNFASAQSRNLYQNQYTYKSSQPSINQPEPQFKMPPPQVERKITEQNHQSQSQIDSPEVLKSKQGNSQRNQVLAPQTWGKEQRSFPFSEDTLEIIAQIERKALGEIIHLQQERDNLKKERDSLLVQLQKVKAQAASNQQNNIQRTQQQQQQQKISRTKLLQVEKIIQQNKALRANSSQTTQLKQQNKLLREDNKQFKEENKIIREENKLLKQDNQSLLHRVEHLEASVAQNMKEISKIVQKETYPEYHEPRAGLAHDQYDSQIAVYQNELRRATVVINELRYRLANVPGLQQLHEQGEKIRRQTTQLLQSKAGRGTAPSHESALVRQLQQRLQQQQRGKALFFQELKSFKQRYNELEQQNRALKKSKVSFDPIPRMAGSTAQRESTPYRGIMKKRNNNFGEYEQALNEMKKALY